MCVVLIIPKEARPSIETLRLCERANPHGGGIAWRNAGAVEWLKTNDVNEIDKLALKIKGELVIHFRIASIGGVCNELRHPFPVTKKASLEERGRTGAVLFQNGTWTGFSSALEFAAKEGHKIPDGEMSDARAAAFLVSIYGHKFLAKCGYSRWVYMNAKEIVRYGEWYKRDGIYFSNLHWLPPAPPKPSVNVPRGRKGASKLSQPELITTNDDDENYELYDMNTVRNYWDVVNRNCRRKPVELPKFDKQTHRVCPCCEGFGIVKRSNRSECCPLCGGEKIIAREELATS